jgi:hypothetical protein
MTWQRDLCQRECGRRIEEDGDVQDVGWTVWGVKRGSGAKLTVVAATGLSTAIGIHSLGF